MIFVIDLSIFNSINKTDAAEDPTSSPCDDPTSSSYDAGYGILIEEKEVI